MTFVLGLTGSIGMGKTVTADLFRVRGVPVHDSDVVVHALYRGAAVAPVEAAFPGVTREGAIDRALLSQRVVGKPEAMRQLESIVHPLVRAEAAVFLQKARDGNAPLAVLDIPLLFETGGETRCDAVLVVSAPPEVQRARVLSRAAMDEAKFEALLAKQTPDAEKRRRAHFLVDTSRGFDDARRQIDDILRALAGRARPIANRT